MSTSARPSPSHAAPEGEDRPGRASAHRLEGNPAGHPAPQRGQVGLGTLLFGIFGAPAAWSVQSLVNFSLASHACYPEMTPYASPTWNGLWPILLGMTLLAIVVGVSAGVVSYRVWQRTRGEGNGGGDARAEGGQRSSAPSGGGADARAALEIGEGRTRFMAMAGMLTSISFVFASVVHGIALFMVPPCGT